jgi:thiol-disulfide isomerase/thioredoxin
VKTWKHYLLTVVANYCQGGWCVFCKKINIFHQLDFLCQLWNQTPKLWEWMQLWQGKGLVASQFVEGQLLTTHFHDQRAHMVRFELHFPMPTIQLDGHVHTNATISPPCLQKPLYKILIFMHLTFKFMIINIHVKNMIKLSFT